MDAVAVGAQGVARFGFRFGHIGGSVDRVEALACELHEQVHVALRGRGAALVQNRVQSRPPLCGIDDRATVAEELPSVGEQGARGGRVDREALPAHGEGPLHRSRSGRGAGDDRGAHAAGARRGEQRQGAVERRAAGGVCVVC